MITGRMYLLKSNKSIEDRIKYLIDTYGIEIDNVLYVLINIKYKDGENFKNSGVKVRFHRSIMPDYFLFVTGNKDKKYQNLWKIKEINDNSS